MLHSRGSKFAYQGAPLSSETISLKDMSEGEFENPQQTGCGFQSLTLKRKKILSS